MVHIRGHLTTQEWNWLKAKLNNEFIDSEIADSIKAKISTNEEDGHKPLQGYINKK